ncbi:MAG TPA: 6-phosphogluconolactonase [Anaerolineae bacterium]|nr:6-phosphogluconolactonase [Anaerolineae bacterium]
MAKHNIQIYPTPAELAIAAAQAFVNAARSAVARRGVFRVALSGGSTPPAMHRALVSEALKDRVPWKRIEVFWGDERCVPPEHPDSNYRMAKETLLDYVPIPAHQIHPMPGNLEPQAAAIAYRQTLSRVFNAEDEIPVFDLILLGMGPDGHTASLFPEHPLLKETQRWVAPVFNSPKPPPQRITLTLPLINAARHILFLVAGTSKTQALKAIFANEFLKTKAHPAGYIPPAALVNPVQGDLRWLLDKAAAGEQGGR